MRFAGENLPVILYFLSREIMIDHNKNKNISLDYLPSYDYLHMSDEPFNTGLLSTWWSQTLEGDNKAFADIHKELFDGLYYYALKLLDDNGVAKDAIQELFIKLWVKRNTIGELKNVKAYFFTSLRRQILNHTRGLKLRNTGISLSEEFDIDFSPEEIIIKNQEDKSLHEKLMLLLNELPQRQKEAIYLHYFEDMDYDQVASVMGINYQSVLNLVHKALKQLRSAKLLAVFLSAVSFSKMVH
jgi:RNA polymerase sigma factor (sigma-70 family)